MPAAVVPGMELSVNAFRCAIVEQLDHVEEIALVVEREVVGIDRPQVVLPELHEEERLEVGAGSAGNVSGDVNAGRPEHVLKIPRVPEPPVLRQEEALNVSEIQLAPGRVLTGAYGVVRPVAHAG